VAQKYTNHSLYILKWVWIVVCRLVKWVSG